MRSPALALCLALAAACGGAPSTASFGYQAPPGPRHAGTSLASLDRALAVAVARNQAPRAEPVAAPPLALTTSDGAGLALAGLDIATVVIGPLAVTQLHLRFKNPEARVREGRFTIALPTDAAVSRFAMKRGAWLEAEVVPRQEARRVYEAFLKQRVDPALLEQGPGNSFSARVFPIAASAEQELLIAYSHPAIDAATRRVALAGLPAVDALTWSITVDGVTTRGAKHGEAPSDLVLAASPTAPPAVASDGAFVARIVAPGSDRVDPLGDVTLLVDTSASRASMIGRQLTVVQAAIAEVARTRPDAIVRVIAFDQTAEQVAIGRPEQVIDRVGPALYDRGGLGASDLGAAIDAATGADRAIVIGDGVATAGERGSEALVARVRAAGIARLDAITVGAATDREALQALALAGARPGAVIDGDVDDVATRLREVPLGALAIEVAGADAVWPSELRGVRPGAALLISGRRGGDASAPIAVQLGAAPVQRLQPTLAPAPLVTRAAARAEITALTARAAEAGRSDEARAADRAAIETLGRAHRLITAATSLLILETDDDYARFCLRRDGLSDLLTVTGGALQVIDRSPGGAPPAPGPCAAPREPAPVDADDAAAPIGRTFENTLGAAAGAQEDALGVSFSGASSLENEYVVDGVGEIIVIEGRAPVIDVGSTRQGITITEDYTRNIPTPGRTFGKTAGSQRSLDPRAALEGARGAHPLPTEFSDHAPPPPPPPPAPPPYDGTLLTVMASLARGDASTATTTALRWYLAEPTELAAIVALGEAFEARGAVGLAARAYGSLLDRFAGRAELARFAGERLDRLGPTGRTLALDAYRQAVADRPDQVGGHRLLALALVRAGDVEGALAALVAAMPHTAAPSIADILRGDLATVAAVAIARTPDRRAAIVAQLAAVDVTVATTPSVRVVLHWETDTNDVDLHVRDRTGGHAYFSNRELPSGGRLLDDITTGFGPEEFRLDGAATAGPYRIGVHYFARGPMGLGLGTVQVLRHDGAGTLTVDDRPFVLSTDGVDLDLGAF